MQWLENPKQSNAYNQNNVRREASRHFRNKTKEYLKTKIEELQNKTKNISYLNTGIMTLRRVTSLELIQYWMRRVIWLQTPTAFWLDQGIISLSY